MRKEKKKTTPCCFSTYQQSMTFFSTYRDDWRMTITYGTIVSSSGSSLLYFSVIRLIKNIHIKFFIFCLNVL